MIKGEELPPLVLFTTFRTELVTSSQICARKGAINFKEIPLTMLLYRIKELACSSIRLLDTRNWILDIRNARKFNSNRLIKPTLLDYDVTSTVKIFQFHSFPLQRKKGKKNIYTLYCMCHLTLKLHGLTGDKRTRRLSNGFVKRKLASARWSSVIRGGQIVGGVKEESRQLRKVSGN